MFSVNQSWYIPAINFKREMSNRVSNEVGQQISWEAPVPGFVLFDHILHCSYILCILSAWLAAKKEGQHPGYKLWVQKTKSQALVHKYKSSTSRGQSAFSLWRTRAEANLEMGRASLEKTGEQSEEQETYFIISAISIIINLLCHFFYPFEIAKVQILNKRNGSIND